jgi:integrase
MPKSKPAPGRDTLRAVAGAPYLFVRTHPSGIKSYVFRYRRRGHALKVAIGYVDALTLEDARRVAEVYAGRIALGFDPIAEEKAKVENRAADIAAARASKVEAPADAFTVRDLIKAWAAGRGEDETRSVRYVAATRTTLETTLEAVLDLPARNLDKDRVKELVDEAAKNRGRAAAARAQAAINTAFKRAIKAGKLETNPCAALDQRKLKPRERVLTAIEVPRIWRAAGTLPAPFGAYVRFLAATGVRRNEALNARWSEIEDDLIWHLPANRMKAKRPFTVPLTRAALCALPARGAGDFVFSRTDGAQPVGGINRIKTTLDAAIEADGAGPLAPWVLHDLRRSLATWLGDHAVDYVIADLCLGHGIPLGSSGRTYQRSYKIAERRDALNKWSELLDPEPAPVRKTRPLRVVK